ncbi:FMN-binding negative transcriptional regulator [Azospirillum sp. SYSU D00513]|uniref:FMN-binding negative transcriptional regulator n=1 Tax=Azospirillum sp. SYSU D00513 TaxID=2812561 RepID=UPI001A95E737|nr:FMN-binding negative transcriptional regulator [Azospirillum sp. SYSU D00513]
MYVPPAFREDRLPVLHDAIRQSRLAHLVTLGGDGLEASHVPVMLDPDQGAYGTLLGHLARGNPQWRRAAPETLALAIVMGPDAYVSPSWYETKRETGKVVPTWNYVTVHAHGSLEFFDDPAELLAVVSALTDRHEAGRPDPWAVSDAPEEFIAAQLKGIVGFRLPIARIEGKWKMSQNRNAADRTGVIVGLGGEGEAERAVAALVPGEP